MAASMSAKRVKSIAARLRERRGGAGGGSTQAAQGAGVAGGGAFLTK